MLIKLEDVTPLHKRYIAAKPYPFARIDGLLSIKPSGNGSCRLSQPGNGIGERPQRHFKTVNERKKGQITDSGISSRPSGFSQALASPEFLADFSYVTGIPDLLADDELVGGSLISPVRATARCPCQLQLSSSSKLHRRINLLLYLNPVWEDQWSRSDCRIAGQGRPQVRTGVSPTLNRCVCFATRRHVFRSVTPVSAAAPFPRLSFATYYYTKEPPHWNGYCPRARFSRPG